ncbi:MAG: hypothetical protein IPP51_18045 [Bacteroidetes bacterium]|nr:hypothetical protein [Bacteroidota bacterium]
MKTNIFYGLCLLFVISCSSGKKGDSSADTKSEKVAVPYAGFGSTKSILIVLVRVITTGVAG